MGVGARGVGWGIRSQQLLDGVTSTVMKYQQNSNIIFEGFLVHTPVLLKLPLLAPVGEVLGHYQDDYSVHMVAEDCFLPTETTLHPPGELVHHYNLDQLLHDPKW